MRLPGSSPAFIGLPHHSIGSASRFLPRTRLSAGRLSRLQLFRYVQASEFARLPDRSHRRKFPCRAAEAFYIRAERASLPSHASDMLSARLQAIGGTRTFISQDSQPCRLLPNDADVSIALPKSTVSFPQYGFKVGMSDGAFPNDTQRVARFASVLRALRFHRRNPRTEPRDAARLSTSVRAASHRSTPGVLAPARFLLSRPSSLNRPHPSHSPSRRWI